MRINGFDPNPFRRHVKFKEDFINRHLVDFKRTAKSLIQALDNAGTPFIKITACQLMCLSRVGGLNKFRLTALNEYLEMAHQISIARIPNDRRSIYLAARTNGIKLQTDDDLMIEPEHRNLCERYIEEN